MEVNQADPRAQLTRARGDRAARLRAMPTRLTLTSGQVEEAIAAGRDAARASAALRAYIASRSERGLEH